MMKPVKRIKSGSANPCDGHVVIDYPKAFWNIGILTYGECWHSNHHAFPELARIGLEKGQTAPCLVAKQFNGKVRSSIPGNALLYVGIPFLIAVALVTTRGEIKEPTWKLKFRHHICDSLIIMLGSSVILFEGFVCVVMIELGVPYALSISESKINCWQYSYNQLPLSPLVYYQHP